MTPADERAIGWCCEDAYRSRLATSARTFACQRERCPACGGKTLDELLASGRQPFSVLRTDSSGRYRRLILFATEEEKELWRADEIVSDAAREVERRRAALEQADAELACALQDRDACHRAWKAKCGENASPTRHETLLR